jgi:large subunit ribosomal protein L7/L12
MAEEKNKEEENKEEDTEEAEEKTKEEEVAEEKEEETEEEAEEEAEDEGEDVEVPEKFADIVEQVEGMPVIELNELVKLLEKKWGVSAQAVAAAGGGGGEEEEEKDAYDVELTDFGDSKIGVIKAVKSALGLGLKEAKALVEDAPVVLKEKVATEDAEEMKEAIEEAGGSVELK